MKDWVFKGVVPLMAALMGVAFQAQIQASWGPWLKAATIVGLVAIVGYALWTLIHGIVPVVRRWNRDRRIESHVAHDVVALASRLAETTSSSFILSVGNIMNKLCEAKLCDATVVNAYAAHLNTLGMAFRDTTDDLGSGHIPATLALSRLCALHRQYTGICTSVAPAISQTDRRELKRDWGAIGEHANTLSTQLVELTHRVQVKRGERPSCYFETVPGW